MVDVLLKNRWIYHLLYTEIVYDKSIIPLDHDASEHKVNLTLKHPFFFLFLFRIDQCSHRVSMAMS